MKIEQMKMILCVAESASVSQAASRLFISQPALSKSIRAAETELGRPLFLRDKDGMHLTEFGRIFCSKAESIVSSYEYLKSLSVERVEWHYPSLRVSTCPFRAAGWVYFELARKYAMAASEFRYVSSNSSNSISDVANGHSDLGIINVALPVKELILAELDKASIAYEPLRQFDPMIFVSNDSPLAHSGKTTVKREDLRGMVIFSIYEDMPVFKRMQEEVLSLLGLDTAQQTVYYDPRAGLSDLIRPNEFRCNLDSGDIYRHAGAYYTLRDVARSFRLDPVPFRFEVGVIRRRDAQANPLADEYVQLLRDVLIPA